MKANLGGIMRRRNLGVGFDVILPTTKEAQKYKEMLVFILKSDGYEIENVNGYYDEGMRK